MSKKDPRKANTIPRTKKFVYKRATFAIEPQPRDFEDLLNDAWAATADQSGMRKQIIDEESKSCIVTHYRTQAHGMTFFEILAFTPGMKALAAAVDFSKPTIDVDEYDVKNAKGQLLELIRTIAYVGVTKNHLVLIPSAELRPPEIEAHFNWLLSQATPILTNGQAVRLSNRVPPAKEEAVQSASKIHFSTDVTVGAADDEGGAKKLTPQGVNWAGLRSFLRGLGPQMVDVTSDLEKSGLTEATPVGVDITLSWDRPKKNKRHEMIDRIATGLRHLDSELEYKIKTKHGWMGKKHFLLENMKSVRCRGERPVRDLLWETMQNWIVGLQKDGDIA